MSSHPLLYMIFSHLSRLFSNVGQLFLFFSLPSRQKTFSFPIIISPLLYKKQTLAKKLSKTIDTDAIRWYNSSTSVMQVFFVVPARRANVGYNTALGGRYTDSFRESKYKIKWEVPKKMANDARVKITLVCSECKQRNYDTKKNKKNDPDRLEMNKYCRFCRKHTLHKESK